MNAPLEVPPVVVDHTAIGTITRTAHADLVSIRAVTIDTDTERDALATELRQIVLTRDDLDAKLKRATDPLNAALKEIRGWFTPARDALDALSAALRGELSRYEGAKREEQRRQFQAAQQAATAGDMASATTALVQASASTPTKIEGVTVVESWVATITNPAAVPREWCVPDEKRIAAHARAAGKGTPAPIAGVLFNREARTRVSR